VKASFGSNELAASASFDQRIEYAENYPAGMEGFRTLDFWRQDLHYGRMNGKGDPIYPSEAFLKPIKDTGKKTYLALNFVADAYEGFRRDVRQEFGKNNFLRIEGTPYESLFAPTRAWVSVSEKHTLHIQNFYEKNIIPYMTTPAVAQDIIDFDDFLEAFTRLINRVTLLTSFTKTEFLLSKKCSPNVSGLVVEFNDEYTYGEDSPKIDAFINNINFELYKTIAFRHGFCVDKNAPWRLIALPGYPMMQQYMKKYEVTVGTLFEKYFYTSYFIDIPTIKSHLFQFYQAFIKDYPDVRVPVMREIKNEKISLTKVIPRAKLGVEEYLERYDDLFWIRLYTYIRAKETNQDWDQHKFDHVVKEASDFLTYSTEQAAFKFIHKEVKRDPAEIISKYRRGSFRFKRKRRYREENK